MYPSHIYVYICHIYHVQFLKNYNIIMYNIIYNIIIGVRNIDLAILAWLYNSQKFG